MPIRDKVSAILGMPIREGRWVTYTEALDREGKFSRKTMLAIIMSLCEEVERLETLANGKWLIEKEIPGVGHVVTADTSTPRARDAKGHYIKAK